MRAVCPLSEFVLFRGTVVLFLVLAGALGAGACAEPEVPAPAPVSEAQAELLGVRWEKARAHHLDPAPSGRLFAGRGNAAAPFISVLLEGGVCALAAAEAEGLQWRGGVVGVHGGVGANQVAVEVRLQPGADEKGGQLMLKLMHAFWLEIVDGRTGEALTELQLLRHPLAGASAEHKPPAPGEVRGEDLLYAGSENPVLVRKVDLQSPSRTVWVRAAGYAWTAVQLRADSAALQRVQLSTKSRADTF